MNKVRCFGEGNPLYAEYHDTEWGVPVHDDRRLFEMLLLEGAQAGLSWETILKRREGYRRAFHAFDPHKVAAMSDSSLESLLQNPEIIRNRAKVFAARQNAQAFLEIQREFGSFDHYLWRFVAGAPLIRKGREESEALSADLKRRGMKFVGPTIIYAFMQAVGMVNDHRPECWLAPAVYTR
ncbi:MAG: DNA-3-methyladenine glycosylase I [Parachlamydiales bacterium]